MQIKISQEKWVNLKFIQRQTQWYKVTKLFLKFLDLYFLFDEVLHSS